MKYMIASDIHGSAYWCEKLAERFAEEKADRLILLGDLLYHGPRNDLPEQYDPKRVIVLLSQLKDSILCVRGNCEAEVDQMVLPFPVLTEFGVLEVNGRLMYITHGHRYNIGNPPPLQPGDILLYGHTHVPLCEEKDGITFMNPGSVSIPKENSVHGYMTLENGTFLWKDLNGEVYMQYAM
ncbi:MAG: phosphodiesterase [Clostridia bacterium]|nr:phosphodiesterase [Clostridia bacterium]